MNPCNSQQKGPPLPWKDCGGPERNAMATVATQTNRVQFIDPTNWQPDRTSISGAELEGVMDGVRQELEPLIVLPGYQGCEVKPGLKFRHAPGLGIDHTEIGWRINAGFNGNWYEGYGPKLCDAVEVVRAKVVAKMNTDAQTTKNYVPLLTASVAAVAASKRQGMQKAMGTGAAL